MSGEEDGRTPSGDAMPGDITPGEPTSGDVRDEGPLPEAPARESFPEGELVFAPGTEVADTYRIDAHLGAGAMGEVYRATELESGQPVALKVLLKGRKDPALRERFEREQAILERIDHAAIVDYRGHGLAMDGEVPWLAMELLEGETLRERVERRGRLDPEELVPIAVACSSALEAAHEAGVVHRDLKPDHIFLPRIGPAAKLLDFGLSLSATSKKLTATGMVIGTPRYMAPEQIASAHTAGASVDVYALGVVLYEALVGDSPFVAADHGQLLGAILQGRTEPLTMHRPDLNPDLELVLAKAMAPQPEHRYDRPMKLAADFAAAAGVRISAPEGTIPAASPRESLLADLRNSTPPDAIRASGATPAPSVPAPAIPQPERATFATGERETGRAARASDRPSFARMRRDPLVLASVLVLAVGAVALGALVAYALLR